MAQCLGNSWGKDKVNRLLAMPFMALAAARGALFVWVPVMMGIGIGIWFALPFEPGLWQYVGLVLMVGLGFALHRWGRNLRNPLLWLVSV